MEVDDNMECITDEIVMYELGNPKEIKLFEYLNTALDIIKSQRGGFNVVNSTINDGIHYKITTNYPDVLPQEAGCLFFDIDAGFNVSCVELPPKESPSLRNYEINIQKL